MKRFLAILAAILLPITLLAQTITTATVSVTNTAGTTNGQTIAINASTRTWTNSVQAPAIQILTNSASTGAATNMFNQYSLNPVAGISISWGSSTSVVFRSFPGQALTITLSDGWGGVSYTTNVLTSARAVRVPMTVESAGPRAEIASQLVTGLNDNSTNSFFENSISVSNLVGRTNDQIISGIKQFTNTSGNWAGGITNSPGINGVMGAVSNGIWWNGVLRAPTLTNGINYGNAFRSPGSATASEQFGTSATASGVASVAFGQSAQATANNTVALGYSAQASEADSIAIGPTTFALKPGAIAIGSSASANGTNSVALGYGAAVTANNSIVLGSSSHDVQIPGGLYVAGGVTNLTALGTNTVDGHIKFIRKANSALANGANAAVNIFTNTFVEVSGPTAAFSIAGIANGSDGRVLILLNQTGYAMTILHDSGLDATAANRIYTGSSADVVLSGRSTAVLIYSAAASRWILGPNESGYTGLGSATLNCNTNMVVTTSSSTNDVAGWTYNYASGTIGVYTNDTFWVTNTGSYEISFGAGLLATSSDVLKLMLYTNDVHCGVIQLQATMAASPITETGFKRTMLPLPANCRVRLKVANDSAASTTLSDVSFNIHGVQ